MGKGMFWVLLLLPMLRTCCCWGECPPHELSALNHFKQALDDPFDALTSWRGSYCCSWKGITCDTHTGHVVRMDIGGYEDLGGGGLFLDRNSSSQIFPAIFQLKQHLQYLDLSGIDLSPLPIPSHLPTLKRLRHLSFRECGLSGPIPSELGNMSSLEFLDISRNPDLEMRQSSSWIRNLRGLEHLDLGGVNLTIGAVENVASLPNLTSLVMSELSAILRLLRIASLFSLLQRFSKKNMMFVHHLEQIKSQILQLANDRALNMKHLEGFLRWPDQFWCSPSQSTV